MNNFLIFNFDHNILVLKTKWLKAYEHYNINDNI